MGQTLQVPRTKTIMVNTSFTLRWVTPTPCLVSALSSPRYTPEENVMEVGKGEDDNNEELLSFLPTEHTQMAWNEDWPENKERRTEHVFHQIESKIFLPAHNGVFSFHIRGKEFTKPKRSYLSMSFLFNCISKSRLCPKLRLCCIFSERELDSHSCEIHSNLVTLN